MAELPKTAQITYDAAREILYGTIGKDPPFQMKAYSGGSRGHKAGVSAEKAKEYLHDDASSLTSRLANTKEIKDKHGAYVQRGGTIPPGHYDCHYIAHHKSFGECIWLKQQADARAIYSPFSPRPIYHSRGGFFIHGSGAKGSDGCVVPEIPAQRLRLNRAIKAFPGRVVLLVKNVSYILPAEVGGMLA